MCAARQSSCLDSAASDSRTRSRTPQQSSSRGIASPRGDGRGAACQVRRMKDTWPLLDKIPFPTISRGSLTTLQVNLGYRCNQSCVHCHVAARPNRTEAMHSATIDLALDVLGRHRIHTLDVTGGAPELHPEFRRLVAAARDLGVRVMDRCNLTILSEPGQEDTAAFLAENEVEVVASMPCYLADNVDRQRGNGVFDRSILGLRTLNAVG